MSIWENEVDVTAEPTVIKIRKQDESEDDSDIKDNWDDSDSESEEEELPVPKKVIPKPTPAPKAAPPKPKSPVEAPISEKEIQRALIVESDIQNAEDLFSGLNIKDVEFKNAISNMNPKTEADFAEFARIVGDKIKTMKNNRYYGSFVANLAKDLANTLPEKEINAISRSLTSLAHEKQRAAKAAAKNSKKGKANVVVDAPPKASATTKYYGDDYDDFDDFM